MAISPIGVFDSGYGGLTIFRRIVEAMPQYDYLYLGDNARAPYGNRSFESVYQYTLQSVSWFFEQGCPLVILACNTASAKALRSIQQNNLPRMPYPNNRVLGVIRPTTEWVGAQTQTGKVGILATKGTVASQSYPLEIAKFWPEVTVFQQACPLLVPLIENNDFNNIGAKYFIEKYTQELLAQSPDIDTVLLGCTHYPIIEHEIQQAAGNVRIISQGPIVAASLVNYLERHPEMETRLSRGGSRQYFTTDDPLDFDEHAGLFFGTKVSSKHVHF